MSVQRLCPDCGGAIGRGTIHGTGGEPIPCAICWACGWQQPAVYQRSRAARNSSAYGFADYCLACDAPVWAATEGGLPDMCPVCVEKDARPRPVLSAAAVQGRARRSS